MIFWFGIIRLNRQLKQNSFSSSSGRSQLQEENSEPFAHNLNDRAERSKLLYCSLPEDSMGTISSVLESNPNATPQF